MTLFQFAKKFCSNMSGDDFCDVKECVCLLKVSKPCDYFRESVWPNCDPGYRYATQTESYPKLVQEFRFLYGMLSEKSVRRCVCGEVLKKRERMCPKCRKKHRRETKRNQMRKYRG